MQAWLMDQPKLALYAWLLYKCNNSNNLMHNALTVAISLMTWIFNMDKYAVFWFDFVTVLALLGCLTFVNVKFFKCSFRELQI